ncbi:MAG: hypothetical protein C0599_12910 [Salinivirgaceae bacterium]|nr:MAG: hypothetical protein C0599_12910 [Salinivirgaceae bacterium]
MRSTLFILTIIAIAFSACKDDEILTSPSVQLKFSTDTIMFDTVFTGIGSATKRFKVYNTYDQAVKISSIQMGKGNTSKYHMNVDGYASNLVTNLEIASKDSIFVFVEVNIDPSEDDLIEEDSIVFQTNGNIQDIKMLAFGQNINLLKDSVLSTSTWGPGKPYLIYSSILVDSLETLNILPGTKVYFHEGASLFVRGSLKALGNISNIITFQGDRLETFYEDKPGQWGAYTYLENGATYVFGGIHFLPGSFENEINYAIIKNANKGIQLDSAVGTQPTLKISNTIISNMNLAGIYAQTSRVNGFNLVINNCASHAIALTLGGDYNFNQITIANYTPYAIRNTASVALNNYFTYNNAAYVYDLTNVTFTNSIIYGDGGDMGNEIVIDYAGEGIFNYLFDHCLVKLNEDFDATNEDHFKNLIISPQEGPRFVNRENYIFELDTLSPAINAGKPEYGIINPIDLNGKSRTVDQSPDMGAYERNQ